GSVVLGTGRPRRAARADDGRACFTQSGRDTASGAAGRSSDEGDTTAERVSIGGPRHRSHVDTIAGASGALARDDRLYSANPTAGRCRDMPFGGNDWLALTVEPTIEPEIPICDPHHHFWDFRTTRLPYQRYLLHELAADIHAGHNVRSTVF